LGLGKILEEWRARKKLKEVEKTMALIDRLAPPGSTARSLLNTGTVPFDATMAELLEAAKTKRSRKDETKD